MDDAEGERCCDQRLNKLSEVAEENAYVAANETEGEAMEAHDIGKDVNGDGVHPKPNERPSPASEIPDFDNLNEDGQQNCGITASNQDVGGGPEKFDDWELK